jgi:hypothetical protein
VAASLAGATLALKVDVVCADRVDVADGLRMIALDCVPGARFEGLAAGVLVAARTLRM